MEDIIPVKSYRAKLDDYELGKKLGSGLTSKVRMAYKGEARYAMKYMSKTNIISQSIDMLKLLFGEAEVMAKMHHPNIIRLYDYKADGTLTKSNGKTDSVLYLALECATGGELFDYIVAESFSDRLSRYYFRQLIFALEHLHSQGYCHRDIKAENILLDDKFNLKLADFGFAGLLRGKDGSGKLLSSKGTPGYVAPEIIKVQPYSGEKVDVFSAGVLLFSMMAQHPPFNNAMMEDKFYKLFCYQNAMFWTRMSAGKIPGLFSPNFKSLINGMLALNPNERFTIAQVKAHPWFNEPAPTAEEAAAEISARLAKVEEAAKEEAKERMAKKRLEKEQLAKKTATRGGMGPHIATKAAGEEAKTVKAATTRVIEEYKPLVKEPATLYSVNSAEDLLEGLTESLKDQHAKVAFKENTYRGHCTLEEPSLSLELHIEKVNENVNCVRIIKTGGDKLQFLRVYHNIKESLIEKSLLIQSIH